MNSSPEECAGELLEVVPMLMRSIRAERNRHRISGLSVQQVHTMLFLQRHPDTSLVVVAERMGLTPPSVSKMMDGLVARDLVVRQASSQDRRRIELHLSAQGEQSLEAAQHATLEGLIAKLKSLSTAEREGLGQSLHLLRTTFSEEGGAFQEK